MFASSSPAGPFRLPAAVALAAGLLLSVSACASGDPLAADKPSSGASDTIVVGSAGFAESEIIAEMYAQALEAQGVTVSKQLNIGQRDVYLAALTDGSIDVIPEYSGNLLQYYSPDSTAKSSQEVFDALGTALPKEFSVLDQAQAEDKDSYNVTAEFSEKHNLNTLADLANINEAFVVGGNPELAERPYGPKGLTDVYGVKSDLITFSPINDSGGPLTVSALKDGTIQVADIFSTTPAIAENKFVTLTDPENLILPQNVVPLISSDKASDLVTKTLNEVSSKLTTEDLIELNARNQGDEKAAPATLAQDWLTEKGLL